MDTSLPLLLFFGFFFVSTIFVLVVGYLSREQERDGAAKQDAVFRMPPSFFLKLAPGVHRRKRETVDDVIVDDVERFLAMEEALVDDFVAEPSLDRLFDSSERERRFGDSLVGRVERYLESELEQVSGFVSDPSTERLYDASQDGFSPTLTLLRDEQSTEHSAIVGAV